MADCIVPYSDYEGRESTPNALKTLRGRIGSLREGVRDIEISLGDIGRRIFASNRLRDVEHTIDLIGVMQKSSLEPGDIKPHAQFILSMLGKIPEDKLPPEIAKALKTNSKIEGGIFTGWMLFSLGGMAAGLVTKDIAPCCGLNALGLAGTIVLLESKEKIENKIVSRTVSKRKDEIRQVLKRTVDQNKPVFDAWTEFLVDHSGDFWQNYIATFLEDNRFSTNRDVVYAVNDLIVDISEYFSDCSTDPRYQVISEQLRSIANNLNRGSLPNTAEVVGPALYTALAILAGKTSEPGHALTVQKLKDDLRNTQRGLAWIKDVNVMELDESIVSSARSLKHLLETDGDTIQRASSDIYKALTSLN